MAISLINPGTSAGAGNGDAIRDGFIKANGNFQEIAQRLAALERWGLVYGAYNQPGAAPFADMLHTDGVMGNYLSHARWQSPSVGSVASAQGARMCVLSPTRILVTYINSTTQTFTVVDFAGGVVTSASATRTVTAGAVPLLMAAVSDSFARVLMRNGNLSAANPLQMVDVTFSGGVVTVSAGIAPTPNAAFIGVASSAATMPSANIRGYLVGATSILAVVRAGGTAQPTNGNVSAVVLQRGQGATPMLDAPVLRHITGSSSSLVAHDHLGNGRFLVFGPGLHPVTGTDGPRVTVIDASDDGVAIISAMSIPGAPPSGSVSCWAISPTLGLVAWYDGSSYRTAAIGIDSAGKCAVLGPASSNGQSGAAVTCGVTETTETFLQFVASGSVLNAHRFTFNRTTGQWDSSATPALVIAAGWLSSGSGPAVIDAVKLGRNRVALLIHNSATSFPVGLDIIDLIEPTPPMGN